MLWHESGPQEASAFTASDLKICDLCGALNLAANRECFVCRWHGRFERRADVVNMVMELMERKHGRLEAWLLSGDSFSWARPSIGLLARAQALFHRIKAWMIR